MTEPGTTPDGGPPLGPEPEWEGPRPRHLPRPTSSPVLCAAGVVLVCWSLLTSAVLAVAGGALFVTAFVIWIREIVHERQIEQRLGR